MSERLQVQYGTYLIDVEVIRRQGASRLMELRFVASESTFAYFEALKAYLRRHGKPVAFYSDKHSIFRVSNENAISGNGMTQFGRACQNSTSKFYVPIPARRRVASSARIIRCRIVW